MNTQQLRRSALTLFALNEADREWMLARLERAHRRSIRRMLTELQTHGFPKDPELVRAALESSAAAADQSARAALPIERHAPRTIRQALAGEPIEVVAVTLECIEKKVASKVLELFDIHDQRPIKDALQVHRIIAPKLREALRGALASRIQENQASRPLAMHAVRKLGRRLLASGAARIRRSPQ
jgi:hypothetical protein